MDEEKELVFSGVACQPTENVCKVWWVATIQNITHTVLAEIPKRDAFGGTDQAKELILEGIFKDSKVKI
jgi:hypothetical protein